MADTGARERLIADAREWLALIDGLNKTTGMQEAERLVKGLLAAGVGVPPDEDLVANSANYAEIRARAERLTRSIWGEPTRAEQAGLDVLTLLDALAGVGEARPAEPPGYGWGGVVDEENARLRVSAPTKERSDARASGEPQTMEEWRAAYFVVLKRATSAEAECGRLRQQVRELEDLESGASAARKEES